MSPIIRFGLMLSAINIIFTLVVYVIDPTLFAGFTFGILSLVISIGLLIGFGVLIRKEQGNYMSYSQAYFSLFMMSMITIVFSIGFSYLLYNVIDPHLADTIKKAVMENTEKMLRNFNVPADEMDKALSQIEDQDFSMSIGNIGRQFFGSAAVNLVVCAILALFIKRKKEADWQQ